ncbi:hypothetical protein [Pseudooceanicola nanhaiensis]|jgi:hypothetical protein|uniref:Uncharacterized protein n=1 Tax=Pseudooceanicola nanhaiensis TaxID=375761 RepID=A0A917T324_9RHOB|nr:hypothetical protein [Pseudooceanicola nanhaiensis]GGM08446.1 hypothetical protein GCM10011534_33060 [Pseudooceanicola nanhaiensis]
MTTETDAGPDETFAITLIGLEDGKHYFVYRGEEYLNQLMLTDGVYPTPVQCLHFHSQFDARMSLGQSVNVSRFWSLHPDIVARLRDTGTLVETGA